MAELFPFSSVTAERLRAVPQAGDTHRWLAQVASGLSRCLDAERCAGFLRRCCDEFVAHRAVPDREIAAAIELAYGPATGAGGSRPVNFGRGALKWPEPNAELIGKVLNDVEPVFDGATSTGLRPREVLPALFNAGELVCAGRDSASACIRRVEALRDEAELLQFVVVNPMKGPAGVNQRGERSARCQANVRLRRHVVAEFDDAELAKPMQARLASALGQMAPLVLVVDSGGKSLHAWYRVEAMPAREQARFFWVACLLGADRTRWDVCGWLRMPGGLRVVDGVPRVRQRILYFEGRKGVEDGQV